MKRSENNFFFQAEDGIQNLTVTGIKTCALPISRSPRPADGICLNAAEATGPAVADVTAALLGSLLELSRTSIA